MEEQKKGFFFYYDKIEDLVLIIGFLAIICLAFAQVVCRTVFNISFTWMEEIIRYIYIWLCWLGVSLAERRNEHIRLEFMVKSLPDKVKKILDICVTILMILLAAWLVNQGVQLVLKLFASGSVSAGAKIPMYLVYISLPVGSFLYGMRMVAKLPKQIKNFGKGGQ